MSNEQRHERHRGSIKWWVPVLISGGALLLSGGALVVSYLSWRQSDEALEWTKREAERRRETRLNIDAEWTHEQVYLSNLRVSPDFSSMSDEELYEGIEAYTLLKVSNQSDHTITIEKLRWYYVLKHGVRSTNRGKIFKSESLKEDIRFPVMLQHGELFRAVTRIPVPVTERVAKALQKLKPDTLHPSLDVFSELIANMADVSRSDVATLHSLQEAKNLPGVLIMLSDSPPAVHRGERQLEIAVSLGSGEVYVDTVDFIDINRSVWEF